MKQATIAMPIFNGAFSLPEVFRYLELEQNKDRVAQIKCHYLAPINIMEYEWASTEKQNI